MSVWSTKSLGRDRAYIVLKHTLPNVNYVVNGIKFRGGYAVVEKNSKSYNELKKVPIIRSAQEYPLTFLRKLPFITRTSDVKLIYGTDVFNHFIKAEATEKVAKEVIQKEEAVKEHIESSVKCKFKTPSGDFCNHDLLEESPSGYCAIHLLKDPRFAELGIELPQFIAKDEKKQVRQKLLTKLAELKKQGKF